MPLDEICAVLATDDPVVVHRHLELHQERLAERFEDQRRMAAALERAVTKGRGLTKGHRRRKRLSDSGGTRASRPAA